MNFKKSAPPAVQYYDRTVSPKLVDLLRPGEALAWLPDHLRKGTGNLSLADIQFRKDAKARKAGALQIYVGSTSVLEILAPANGSTTGAPRPPREGFKLTVGAQTYRKVWGDMPTGRLTADELRSAKSSIAAYLRRASEQVTARWLDKESKAHAGFMRRYGFCGDGEGPCLAVDREVVIGHSTDEVRKKHREQLRKSGRENKGRVSSELDALVVLQGGKIGLVELKAAPEGLPDAAAQVLTYLDRFRQLQGLRNGIHGVADLLAQKLDAGLVPKTRGTEAFSGAATLRPVIAIPDEPARWMERWRSMIAKTRREEELTDLLLWRLSPDGEILDEARAFGGKA